jgi:hypothetical protein
MFLMASQVKKSGQCQLRDKKHQYFSIVSLPTGSVIADHAVCTILYSFNKMHCSTRSTIDLLIKLVQ